MIEVTEQLKVLTSIINKNNDEINLLFSETGAGNIELRDKYDRLINTYTLAGNLKKIRLNTGESRTYVINVDKKDLNKYSEENPDVLTESQSKIFSLAKTDIELNIILNINLQPSISTNLKYSVEVD